MSFLTLSTLILNTAHIIAIQTETADYVILTSRTYTAGYQVDAGRFEYSYPERFVISKASVDGGIIRAWLSQKKVKVQKPQQPQPQQEQQDSPRHVSAALRRLNENIRRESPLGSRSASPAGLKATACYLSQ